jgi:chromosome segregation ATPase
MNVLFVTIGIAIITLLITLLWYVPHLLQRQTLRAASETAVLRDMLLDLLNEQEALHQRQAQLSAGLAYLQQQISGRQETAAAEPARIESHELRRIDQRIATLHQEIQSWVRNPQRSRQHARDNEAWANLLGLLSAIQDRVAELEQRHSAAVAPEARVLLNGLEQEMTQLRNISTDIATLQWRLRQSMHESAHGETGRKRTSSNTARPA